MDIKLQQPIGYCSTYCVFTAIKKSISINLIKQITIKIAMSAYNHKSVPILLMTLDVART